MKDKLTIAFCEQMANGVKAVGDLRPLFKQLADTLRAAEKVWHTHCDQDGTTESARNHAEAMKRLWREIGMPDHPYKHSFPVYEDQHITQYDATDRSLLIKHEQPKTSDDSCRCRKCLEGRGERIWRMVLCSECGNKRCPHATDHTLVCTNSNEPGQKGSAYE